LGRLPAVFYMLTARELLFGIIEAVCGDRMHPAWFRIGGVAQDLPRGWDRKVREFLEWMPKRLDGYRKAALENAILKARCKGVAVYDTANAMDWGVTGPGLRATGCNSDLTKAP